MAWARIDDSLHSHPKFLRAGFEASGLWLRALSYCAGHLTDGYLEADWFEWYVPNKKQRDRLVATLLKVELIDQAADGGYYLHDYLEFNPSAAQVNERRKVSHRKKALHRDRDLVTEVRARDGDVCRYCASVVEWGNRKGPTGGTYDHVDPNGPNSLENVVVACRGCNSKKRNRTPAQAAMDLIPVKPRSNRNLNAV